ncbi:MAG: phytanoyl-CoA dioxygenase family protein [Flavobacteriales bacterium]
MIPVKNKSASESDIISGLSEHGVLVIEDYCSRENVEKLREEFELILSKTKSNWLEERPYSLGKAALLTRNSEMKKEVPLSYEFFSSPFMQNIVNTYFGKGYTANQKIFVVKDVVGSSHHANDLHFDVQRTLKFFLYLSDTDEKNGAFKCVPGSNHLAEKIRKENPELISYENREFSRKLPYGTSDAISVNGKAGSLIIFDTNVSHQAGNVSVGERWVMRGQTEAFGMQAKKKMPFLARVRNKLGF